MSTVKQLDNVREGYPELHDFDGSEYVKASDYDERLHASDVYFDSWKNTEAQFNQQKLELDAACGEIALLKEDLATSQRAFENCKLALDAQTHNYGVTNLQLIASQQRLTVAEQRLGEAYDWGYSEGQSDPNGYSDKEDREKCVAELLKPAAEGEGS